MPCPTALNSQSGKKRSTIATALFAALMMGTALTSADSLAQDNTAGTHVRFDGKQVTSSDASFFVSNQILVQTAPGTDVVDLINNFITDTPTAPKPKVRKITADGTLFELTYTVNSGENESAAGGIQNLISDADPKAANLPGTKLLSALAAAPSVISATRNYLARIAQSEDINSIIGGGDGSENGHIGDDSTTPTPKEPVLNTDPVFPNDPSYNNQWHLKLYGTAHDGTTSLGGANFPVMWAKTQGAENIVVAVVDSGIAANHPDIDYNRNILPGFDFVSAATEFADDGTPGPDADPTEPQLSQLRQACPQGTADSAWHGSHVAGIVGAASANNGSGIASGAWNVKILPVRSLSKCGVGTRLDIALGIYWAAGISINGVPDNPNPADIINLSLGGNSPNGCDPIYKAAIDAAAAKGITVVVAAGNSGSDATTSSPANCTNVISVAASDARGHLTDYSNFGSLIDILAPGGAVNRDDNGDGQPDGILSTIDADFTYYQGTSMASPLVASAAALLKSENPNLTPGQIRKLLKDNAIRRDDIQCPKGCGAGLLNMAFSH